MENRAEPKSLHYLLDVALVEQIINSELSKVELDEFLAGLHSENAVQLYSECIEETI